LFRVLWIKIKYFLLLVLGVVGGYSYYTYFGCNGRCPISGNPYISIAYGGLIGALITDWKIIFTLLKKQHKNEQL